MKTRDGGREFSLFLILSFVSAGGAWEVDMLLGFSIEAAKTKSQLSAATLSPFSRDSSRHTGSGSDSAGRLQTLIFSWDLVEASAPSWDAGGDQREGC